ncbi:MAG: ATP-binding protein, partial [Myxococcota bacterium]|nr:ATP-binding protein [Myxococcota bacterium]
RAYTGANINELLRAHLEGDRTPFDPRTPVPQGFDTWLNHLMARSPRARFQRAADAAWALAKMDPPEDEGAGLTLSLDDTFPAIEAISCHSTVLSDPLAATTERESRTYLGTAPTRHEIALASTVQAAQRHFDAPPPMVADTVAAAHESPPLPETWRHDGPRALSFQLMGAGLGLYGQRTIPIVDRTEERDAMWRLLEAVWQKREARMLFLRGPAGMGKSRLSEWMSHRTHELGASVVLRAHHEPISSPSHGLPPMAARHLRCQGLDRGAVLSRVFRWLRAREVRDETLAHAITEFIHPGTQTHRDEGMRVVHLASPSERYDVLAQLLSLSASARPVVVLIDDAQWGYEALAFARFVLASRTHRRLPVLFVATVRDESLVDGGAEGELIEAIEAMEGQVQALHIGPIPEADRAELIRELLGLEPQLAQRVEARTAGDPLFAAQLVGDWVQRGLLVASDGGLTLREGAEAELPQDLAALWSDRIERILTDQPPTAGLALELAATLGFEQTDAVAILTAP